VPIVVYSGTVNCWSLRSVEVMFCVCGPLLLCTKRKKTTQNTMIIKKNYACVWAPTHAQSHRHTFTIMHSRIHASTHATAPTRIKTHTQYNTHTHTRNTTHTYTQYNTHTIQHTHTCTHTHTHTHILEVFFLIRVQQEVLSSIIASPLLELLGPLLRWLLDPPPHSPCHSTPTKLIHALS
jgi:hypothetical protein